MIREPLDGVRMKGTNTLRINHETMVEAVNYWLNRQVLYMEGVNVTAVSRRKEGFIVTFDSVEKAKPSN